MGINNRLSTILTQHAGEMAFVQRSQYRVSRLFQFTNAPQWNTVTRHSQYNCSTLPSKQPGRRLADPIAGASDNCHPSPQSPSCLISHIYLSAKVHRSQAGTLTVNHLREQ